MMSESLQGIVDESQFYQKSSDQKSLTKLVFSGSDRFIDIDVDSIQLNSIEKELEIKFECNAYLTGEILDGNFCRVEINFLGYVFTREITSTKKTCVDFSTKDLCTIALTFEFASPI